MAAYQSIRRLFEPQPLTNLGWVLAAALIGFAGNELVAVYRIRVGRQIRSAALVADGLHARTDGFTSLAVVLGVIGVWAGFPLADPVVGLLISTVIFILLWGTTRDIGRRLLDGVDPSLVDRAEHSIRSVPGINEVETVRMRWLGHRLSVEATVTSDPAMPVEPVPPTRAPGGRSHPEQRARRRRRPAQPVHPRTSAPGRPSVTRCQCRGLHICRTG